MNFEVTMSKVKVTILFYAKNISAQYLEKFLSDSHDTWSENWLWSVNDPFKF